MRIQSAIGVCLHGALSVGAMAQCQYTVTEVEPFPCQSWSLYGYTGHGLNNLGAWCGYREMCGGGAGDLPIYCPPGGTPQVLPMPPNAGPMGAQATAVNDAGVVVGFSFQGTSGSVEVGCIWWPDGTVEEIPAAPGVTGSRAMGVNNLGDICGQTGNKPYVWSNGVMQVIDPAPLLGAWGGDISDTGWVTGTGGGMASGRAFRCKDGIVEILPPLGGLEASEGRDVDAAGTVVGISRTYVGGSQGYISLPCVWTTKSSFVLSLPQGYSQGGAIGINEDGVIIGSVSADQGSGLPLLRVVWIDGVPFDINALTLPESPSSGGLTSINEAGAVLAGGAAMVLTPLGGSSTDLNGDCAVDGADIAKLLSEWGPREWSVADLDGDGIVNGRDLGLVLGAWTGSK